MAQRPNHRLFLHIAICIFATIGSATSGGQSSSLLSQIFKKVPSQNEPIVLVIDSSFDRNDDENLNPLSGLDSYFSELNSRNQNRRPSQGDRKDRSNTNYNNRYDADAQDINYDNQNSNNRHESKNNYNNDRNNYNNDRNRNRNQVNNNRNKDKNNYNNDRNSNRHQINNNNRYDNRNSNDRHNDINQINNNRNDNRNNYNNDRNGNRNQVNNNRNDDRNNYNHDRNSNRNRVNNNNRYDDRSNNDNDRNNNRNQVNNNNRYEYRSNNNDRNNNRNQINNNNYRNNDRNNYNNDRNSDRNQVNNNNRYDDRNNNDNDRNSNRYQVNNNNFRNDDRNNYNDRNSNRNQYNNNYVNDDRNNYNYNKNDNRYRVEQNSGQFKPLQSLRQKDSCESGTKDSCEEQTKKTTTKDPCEEDNSCGDDDDNISTKGMVDNYSMNRELSTYTYNQSSDTNVNTNETFHDIMNYPGTESEDYDYYNERQGIYKTTLTESIAHLMKGATATGVMTMHEAFMAGGLWTSLCFTLCIGFVNIYTMYMLAKSARLMSIRLRVTKLSYPALAEVAASSGCWKSFRRFSKIFRYTVDVNLILYIMGTCCIFQIMIANTFKEILEDYLSHRKDFLGGNDIRLYILACMPLLMSLCLITSLKILAPFSMLADFFIAVCVLATLYYSVQTNQNIADLPGWKSITGFLKFCGICIYSTCGIAICLPIENNMKRPRYFNFALLWAMGIVTALMMITGFFGYWGWGESCRSPVSVHMPRNVFTSILQILLAIMLSATFMVNFWVGFRILWHYISRRYPRRTRMMLKERLYRLLFAFLVTCISLAFPNLIMVEAFIGQFFLGFINFIFPAFIESLITWNDDLAANIRWRARKNLLLVILGFALSGCSFYTALAK